MIANELCRSRCATAVLAFLSTWSLSCAVAQAQIHDMDMTMAVGHVDFSNSCSPSARRDLNSGMAALYSFWFAESHQFFEKAAAKDPDCVIAYWGEAMSDYEQIEGGSLPEGEQLADGQRAIARGEAASRKTDRENAYLDAVVIISTHPGFRTTISVSNAFPPPWAPFPRLTPPIARPQ